MSVVWGGVEQVLFEVLYGSMCRWGGGVLRRRLNVCLWVRARARARARYGLYGLYEFLYLYVRASKIEI